MKKTYRGSCHCGAVRFTCELDLAPAGERSTPELDGVWWTSTFRCNCSYCWKSRLWKGFAREADVEITHGKDQLTEYQFGSGVVHHYFCSRCGIHPFARASLEQMGGNFFAVNIAALDDATPDELARAPIAYEDGRNDAWDRPPEKTGYL